MAIDVYLYLEGIKGESRDAGHKDWLECRHVDWGVAQPMSPACGARGSTTGRCHHYTVDLERLSDLATPILLQACATGKTLPLARFEFMRADGNAAPIRYFQIELANVLVDSVAPGVSEGSPMSEFLSLAFSRIKWRYTLQKIGGGAAGCTVGGWDLAANCVA